MRVNKTFRQAKFVSIAGLILILIATQYPFRFSFNTELQSAIATLFNNGEMWNNGWQDPLLNVILFIPLGFGFSGLNYHRVPPFFLFIMAISVGFVLSVFVELLQLFILVRNSTFSDVITNTIGAASGFILFYYCGVQLLRIANFYIYRIFKKISFSLILTLCIAYLLALNVFWQSLHYQVSLINWDINFPLVLGNEKTGNRPWNGNVYKLYFGDFVIQEKDIDHAFNQGEHPQDKMLALYQLDNAEKANLSDHDGRLISHTKNTGEMQVQKVKEFSSLEFIDHSTKLLNSRLIIASQFTIGAVVQTENTNQTGPARIFTISSSAMKRNIMFGQDANDLVIRLRTPITGDNGSKPNIIIPDLFADTQPHHLIVTYDGHNLRIYVDSIKQVLSFDLMEVAVAEQLFLISYNMPVTFPVNQTGYHFFKYGLFLGFPLSLLWACRKRLF